MNYNLFSNMNYIYKKVNHIVKPMSLWLFLNFISTLLIPILSSLIASAVVFLLTNHYDITQYIAVILIFVGLIFTLESIQNYTFTRYTWENTFVRCNQFWVELSKKTITMDYDKIEPKQRQKLIDRAFEALDSNWVGIEEMLKQTPVFFINIVGMILFSILIGIYVPIVLFILILMSLVNYFLSGRANQYLKNNKEEMNKFYREKYYLSTLVADANNGKDIRIYKLEKWFKNIFIFLTQKRMKNISKFNQKQLLAQVSDTIFLFIRDFIAYAVLILLVIDQKIDVATFTFMLGIVAGFSSWLNGFVESFNELRKNTILVTDYRNCLKEENTFNHEEGIDISSLQYPLQIEFRNVSFIYPETDVKIIQDLNFTIQPGEKIAIVGNNGAGKTTLIKLLSGLYEPTLGEILINGYPLKEFNIDDYMSLLSVVFQDSNPLAFTLLENVICEPVQNANLPKFWEAVEQAGLKEKIENLDKKELTYITQTFDESGIRLSGGEVQKLMLARALYKNAPLLILDEPTAALDPIREEKMYQTYQSFSKGNTSLFISHRLSSTKFCDRIFFLEQGEIAEEGTHEELIRKNGKYREMFDIQSKYYREGAENNEK